MNAILLCAAMLLGADPTLTAPELTELAGIRKSLESVRELQSRGLDVDKDGKVAAGLMDKAGQASRGRVCTYEDLCALTGGSNATASGWEQAKGLFTFVNVLWVLGALLVFAALTAIFGFYFLALVMAIPPGAWCVLLWSGCAMLAASAHNVGENWRLAVLMPACLGFMGAMTLTLYVMEVKWTERGELAWLTLAVLWGVVAVRFGSHVVGFMSVTAALAALGFVAGYSPLCYWIGFEDEDVVPRAATAGGVMLALHVLFTATGAAAEPIAVFREGMQFMGSFVYYLGVLIMSSRYYCCRRVRSDSGWRVDRNWTAYWLMQSVTVASGVAALYFGSVYGMGSLLGVGGTFFCLYILEKYYDLPWQGIGWAWSALGLGGLFYGMGVFIKAHPQYFLFGG